MKLPIDVVLGTDPPVFRWWQMVDAPTGGTHTVDHVSALPPTVEKAVATLIGITKRLISENAVMRGTINMAVDRLGGQVEGRPTHDGNFLQRIDELVGIERVYDLVAITVPPTQSSPVKRTKG